MIDFIDYKKVTFERNNGLQTKRNVNYVSIITRGMGRSDSSCFFCFFLLLLMFFHKPPFLIY